MQGHSSHGPLVFSPAPFVLLPAIPLQPYPVIPTATALGRLLKTEIGAGSQSNDDGLQHERCFLQEGQQWLRREVVSLV